MKLIRYIGSTVFMLAMALVVVSSLHAETSISVAGGAITPVSTPGANYINDNNHPFPYMVFLPKGYSSTLSYPLVFCLHGNGENGDGSSDGTMVVSATNQLAKVLGVGPLRFIKKGSIYFGDNGVIVVQPQSLAISGAAFNANRLDLTMKNVLQNYNIDRNRIYTMGLSAGGGGIVRYAYSFADTSNYQLAVIVPFANSEGVGTTYTNFSKFTKAITWFINCSDDTVTRPILVSGRTWSGYGEGFAGGISLYIDQAVNGGGLPVSTIKNRSLNTHPDLTAIVASNFNTEGIIPANGLTGTYSGSYNPDNPKGWTWVTDQKFVAGSRLQFTLRKGGGHSGWSQTMGYDAPNLQFWDWILAQRLGQPPTSTDNPVVVRGKVSIHPINTTVPKPPYGYLAYLPVGYNPNNMITKYPLVVYLGDTSESGDGTETSANNYQLSSKLKKYGPFYQIATQNWDFPAIIIAAQVTTNWTKPQNVHNVVEYAKVNYRVDTNRIYMTGKLEGANGAMRYAVAYPDVLAAILTVQVNTSSDATQALKIKNTPLWAVHSFADPMVSRTVSIGWMNAIAGGTSDVMGTYPGYGGDRNHFATDSDINGKPLNPNGDTVVITGATVTGNNVAFPTGTTFGSNVFGMWGGNDTFPFANVSVTGQTTKYVSIRGYPTSLKLNRIFTDTSVIANVTIQTPVGYNTTAYLNDTGVWGWNRNQVWDQSKPDDILLSLFWSKNTVDVWTQTWGNIVTWNWLFSKIKAPSNNG